MSNGDRYALLAVGYMVCAIVASCTEHWLLFFGMFIFMIYAKYRQIKWDKIENER